MWTLLSASCAYTYTFSRNADQFSIVLNSLQIDRLDSINSISDCTRSAEIDIPHRYWLGTIYPGGKKKPDQNQIQEIFFLFQFFLLFFFLSIQVFTEYCSSPLFDRQMFAWPENN